MSESPVVRHLVSQFYDAAKQFPPLLHVALHTRDDGGYWPESIDEATRQSFEVRYDEWLESVKRSSSIVGLGEQSPLLRRNSHWFRIDDKPWFGTFYFDGAILHDPRTPMDRLDDAHRRFNDLASQAVRIVSTQAPVVGIHVEFDDPVDRWLETVYQIPDLVDVDEDKPYLVRRLTSNVFTASAISIESIHETHAASKTNERSKPARAKHERWRKWKKEGMSYQEIANRHKDETGEEITCHAVYRGITRLGDSA